MNKNEYARSENRAEPVTVELLCEMYRNVTMGSENLATVVPKISGKFMLSNVTSQLEKYADLTNRTEELLEKRAVKAEKPSAMKKLMSRGGIALNTVFDSSDEHIAEMIIKGTDMGADQLENKLNEFKKNGSDSEAEKLCREIIDYERSEAQKMKEYT